MSKIMELREKRNALWEQTKSYLEEHRNADGMVDAASVEQYDKMAADVKALGEEIKRLEDQAAIDDEMDKPASAPVYGDVKGGKKVSSAEYDKAFTAMLRGDKSQRVLDALSEGKGDPDPKSAGGYTVPDEFERRLVEALEDNNIFRKIGTVIKTNSGTRSIPIATDTGAASWIEEGTAITESDMTFSNATLSAYKMGTLVRASNELINDSAFDIGGYVAKRIGVRFGNLEEQAFFNGKGPSADPDVTPSEPTGILTQLTPADANKFANLTFDSVFALYYSLKEAYRRKASFICNETVMLRLMTLKDGAGQYLWKPSLEIGKPDTLLNKPVYTSQYMPAITGTAADKGKKILLFGDFSYYWIADRKGRTLKRLEERYAEYDQVGFRGTQRVDGKLILPEAVQVAAFKTT